jgi:hypothetical protein
VNWKPTGPKQIVLSIIATVIAFGLGYGLARLIGNHSPGPLAAGLMFGVIMFVSTMFRIRRDEQGMTR